MGSANNKTIFMSSGNSNLQHALRVTFWDFFNTAFPSQIRKYSKLE